MEPKSWRRDHLEPVPSMREWCGEDQGLRPVVGHWGEGPLKHRLVDGSTQCPLFSWDIHCLGRDPVRAISQLGELVNCYVKVERWRRRLEESLDERLRFCCGANVGCRCHGCGTPKTEATEWAREGCFSPWPLWKRSPRNDRESVPDLGIKGCRGLPDERRGTRSQGEGNLGQGEAVAK